jgi:hypothetical protein
MFISKFLAGRNVAKTKLELLTEAWTSIQKYYETADGKKKKQMLQRFSYENQLGLLSIC